MSVTLGDKEFERYQKIKQENKSLKEQISKLQKIIKHANLENKMDEVKKAAKKKKLEVSEQALEPIKEVCPKCQSDDLIVSHITIPSTKQNKTLIKCKKCKHRHSRVN